MKEIALTLPDLTGGEPGGNLPIDNPAITKFPTATSNLGTFLTSTFDLVIFAAGFLMFFWMLWGVFQYIFAGGNKEGLGKARSRITWALVGFILIVMAFAVRNYLEKIFPVFPTNSSPITPITTPCPSPGKSKGC